MEMAIAETTAMPDYIKRFSELFDNVQTDLAELCRFYINDIEKNPEHKEVYQEFFPNLSKQTWKYIELAGRNKAVPEIIFQTGIAIKKLIYCPISEQTMYLKKPIPVLDPVNPHNHLLVMYTDLQKNQIDQVFAYDHIRTLPEQKAWLLSQKNNEEETIVSGDRKPKAPKVINGILVIYYPDGTIASKLTLHELTGYLEEMTR